ncbi:MAG: hypothetical protein EON58_13860 [Alphaproteobacteria bacterium]|nr:MAG: hypothetical protein EON58_13860 [Alphaproteobacteria bacterium]
MALESSKPGSRQGEQSKLRVNDVAPILALLLSGLTIYLSHLSSVRQATIAESSMNALTAKDRRTEYREPLQQLMAKCSRCLKRLESFHAGLRVLASDIPSNPAEYAKQLDVSLGNVFEIEQETQQWLDSNGVLLPSEAVESQADDFRGEIVRYVMGASVALKDPENASYEEQQAQIEAVREKYAALKENIRRLIKDPEASISSARQ